MDKVEDNRLAVDVASERSRWQRFRDWLVGIFIIGEITREARWGWRWGAIVGLMAGIVQAHAVQPIAAATGAMEWRNKFFISIAGAVLYTIALIGFLRFARWALWIAILGPLVGITAVVIGTATTSTVRPDAFQIVGGTLQIAALLITSKLLKKEE